MIIKHRETAMEFEIIPAKEVDSYLDSPKTLIVDLRDKFEYDSYHIPKAVNIPFNDLERQQYSLYNYYQIILYCERGNTSLIAARKLSKLGYRVKNLYGGIQAYIDSKGI